AAPSGPTVVAKGNPTVLWICLALAVITFGLYAGVRQFEFISLDDTDYGPENPLIRKGLSQEGIKGAFTGRVVGNWHPLTALSLMATSQFFGTSAAAFHLGNLLFHVANVVLLFLTMKGLTGRLWPSAIVAGLFAWHPLHVESVAWVSERK